MVFAVATNMTSEGRNPPRCSGPGRCGSAPDPELKQGRRGIAAEILAEFIHLVQQEQRIADATLVRLCGIFAGHGADVGAAMAADFGLVADTASAMRTNLRLVALAMDWPTTSCRLRGPTRQRIGEP